MIIPAFYALLLALPVLLLGEWFNHRIAFLSKFSIPPPMAGGIVVATIVFIYNLSGYSHLSFSIETDASWWTWLISSEIEWFTHPAKNIHLPFLMIFFTSIGMNASWALVKKGSYQVALFWMIALGLAIMQNVLAVGIAIGLGEHPLMGLICGSASMTGGHGTALGFATKFEEFGLEGANVIGAASATFGLIIGGLLGAPLGSILIRRHKLEKHPEISDTIHLESGESAPAGILQDIYALMKMPMATLKHILMFLVVIKLGVWLSYYLKSLGVTFPVYIGSMIVAVALRNILEAFNLNWIDTEIVDIIGGVCLNIFLAVALLSIDFMDLLGSALPMIIILVCQTCMTAFVTYFITIRVMGKDYEAAVMSAGFYGFTMGAVPNALANMRIIVEKYGPAPRAFLVIPLVGAFLIDFTNALNITFFMNFFK